tara:strand:- start:521 stop:688 length:168 start_codon:yes stop_codon:yes gene_type:complete
MNVNQLMFSNDPFAGVVPLNLGMNVNSAERALKFVWGVVPLNLGMNVNVIGFYSS